MPRSLPVRRGLAGSSPAPGFAPDSSRRAFPSRHQSSDEDEGVSTDTTISDRPPPTGGMGVEGATTARAAVTSMALAPLGEGIRKRMDF